MEKENKKSRPALRKEVYDLLKENGVDIKPFQGKLSDILKSVYEHRVVEMVEAPKPLLHSVVCPKCGNYRLKDVLRKRYKGFRKRLPKEVKEQIKTTNE